MPPRSIVGGACGDGPHSSSGPLGETMAWFGLSVSNISEKVMHIAGLCLPEPCSLRDTRGFVLAHLITEEIPKGE